MMRHGIKVSFVLCPVCPVGFPGSRGVPRSCLDFLAYARWSIPVTVDGIAI